MKYDMCGGATVIGTFVAAVKMKLPINLVVVVPAVENAIDGNAYRPYDVITSMSGKTIEVGNTDAEERLILCDALTYVQKYEPQADRKSVGSGKSVSVRGDLGGRRIIKKQTHNNKMTKQYKQKNKKK